MTTVIIPARNEAAVIERCLAALLDDAGPDEFEVIVACNGCTDDTAQLAANYLSPSGSKPRVLEVAEASKIAALNAGLTAATSRAVIVVDADVLLPTAAARALRESLKEPGVLAASTSLDLDLTGASLISRSYHRFWRLLPSVANGLSGRGVYALSPSGRERLGRFPPVIADDRLVDMLFTADERRIVDEPSVVTASRHANELVARKTRVFAGNRELAELVNNHHTGSWPTVIRRHPQAVLDLPTYLGVNLVSKLRARHQARLGLVAWNRDSTTRAEPGAR